MKKKKNAKKDEECRSCSNRLEKYENDILQVRLALDQSKKTTSAASSEASRLREDFNQLLKRNRQQELKIRLQEQEILTLTENNDRLQEEINDILKVKASLQQQIGELGDENLMLSNTAKKCKSECSFLKKELQKKSLHIKKESNKFLKSIESFKRHIRTQTHLNGTSELIYLVNRIQNCFSSLTGTDVAQFDMSPVKEIGKEMSIVDNSNTKKCICKKKISQYRLLIVKSRAKINSLQFQLASEQAHSDDMRNQLVYYKSILMCEKENRDGSDDSLKVYHNNSETVSKTICDRKNKTREILGGINQQEKGMRNVVESDSVEAQNTEKSMIAQKKSIHEDLDKLCQELNRLNNTIDKNLDYT